MAPLIHSVANPWGEALVARSGHSSDDREFQLQSQDNGNNRLTGYTEHRNMGTKQHGQPLALRITPCKQ